MLRKAIPSPNSPTDSNPSKIIAGHVYLIKSGKAYKIGSSRSIYSRTATVIRQSPLGADLIHAISTDDPEGIERYWHERFGSARISGSNKQSGEWFALSANEVAIFKRRKAM